MRHAEKHPELIVSAPITSGNVGISSASDHAESRGRRHGCRGGFWCGVASGVRWLLASGWLPALGGFRRWVASGIGWLLVWLSVSGGFWCRGSFWGGFWFRGGFWCRWLQPRLGPALCLRPPHWSVFRLLSCPFGLHVPGAFLAEKVMVFMAIFIFY